LAIINLIEIPDPECLKPLMEFIEKDKAIIENLK
jgi:hypothetical protein